MYVKHASPRLPLSAAILISLPVATRPHAPQLPPIQSNMSPEDFYPQSATAQLNAVYNREARSPRTSTNPNPPQLLPIGGGPVPKFEKVANTADLRPRINTQPPFRRANPEGGFISVSGHGGGGAGHANSLHHSLSKRSRRICPLPTSCATPGSTTSHRETHAESSRNRAKVSRMTDTTTRIVTTYSTSMTF
jgi:hypothetical protein